MIVVLFPVIAVEYCLLSSDSGIVYYLLIQVKALLSWLHTCLKKIKLKGQKPKQRAAIPQILL